MPTTDLKAIYAAFDHTARLEDIALYAKRERAPSEEIQSVLSFDNNKHWIFCGSIGSGESSELAYLGDLLKDQYFVVGLDLYQSVDDVLTTEAISHAFGPPDRHHPPGRALDRALLGRRRRSTGELGARDDGRRYSDFPTSPVRSTRRCSRT